MVDWSELRDCTEYSRRLVELFAVVQAQEPCFSWSRSRVRLSAWRVLFPFSPSPLMVV